MTTDTTTPPDTRHPYVRFLSALFGAMPPCQMEHEINLIADNPAIGPCVLVTIGQTVASFYPDPSASGGWTAGVSVYADEPDEDGDPVILADVADTGDDPAALGEWVASRLPGLPPGADDEEDHEAWAARDWWAALVGALDPDVLVHPIDCGPTEPGVEPRAWIAGLLDAPGCIARFRGLPLMPGEPLSPSWACDWRDGADDEADEAEAEGDDPMALGVLVARHWSARIAAVRDDGDGEGEGEGEGEGDEDEGDGDPIPMKIVVWFDPEPGGWAYLLAYATGGPPRVIEGPLGGCGLPTPPMDTTPPPDVLVELGTETPLAGRVDVGALCWRRQGTAFYWTA